jgi:polyhydroxyalkanoate synthase subunit PhaC
LTEQASSIIPSDFDDFLEKYNRGLRIVIEGAEADTGRTPRATVWTKNKARLYRYEPEKPKKYPIPILIVYALINRPYVLDLIPGNSFIEYLVGEGFDVYMLDWGIPGDEDSEMSFEHYVLDYLPRAAKKVMRISGSEEFTLFGYCMGGTMSAMYASLFPERLRNLVLLATPTSFAPERTGIFRPWTSESFDPGTLVAAFGNVPADALEPLVETASRARTLDFPSRKKFTEAFLAASRWVDDGVPFPGAAFRSWIADFYQHDRLVKGEVHLRGRRVDLSSVACSLLNVAGTEDLICTLPQAEATMDLVGSRDRDLLVLDAGHVGLMAGPVARNRFWPRLREWLDGRSR